MINQTVQVDEEAFEDTSCSSLLCRPLGALRVGQKAKKWPMCKKENSAPPYVQYKECSSTRCIPQKSVKRVNILLGANREGVSNVLLPVLRGNSPIRNPSRLKQDTLLKIRQRQLLNRAWEKSPSRQRYIHKQSFLAKAIA